MEEEKFKDLLEDEELKCLRLAALATKRRKQQNTAISSDSMSALPINSIVTASAPSSESVLNQIPFVQSDRNAYNNYTWRKQMQSSRRRGGTFLKNGQRSNLIVISPIPLNDDKNSEEKVPPLVLPQHKWCNSGNEDSMSPKTLRRTGPTRFNRHGSDSESSDSDYENSDNDSGSNETVLQDEPPEHFSRMSPENEAVSESGEKQRRLSFQNLESDIKSDAFDKKETTSVYNCLKNSSSFDYTTSKSDNFTSVQNLNDGRHDWNHSIENEYNSYNKYNSGHTYSNKPLDTSDGFVEKQNNSLVSNGESHMNETSLIPQSSDTSLWQHTGIKTSNSYYSRDISSVPDNVRNHGQSDRNSKDYIDKRQSLQICHEIQGPESSVWQQGERLRANSSYFPRDITYSEAVSRNYDDDVHSKEQLLSRDDLRLELKKRMQEIQSKPTTIENCNEIIDHNKVSPNNTWDRNKQRFTSEEDRIGEASCINYENSNLPRNRQDRSFSREKDRSDRCTILNRRYQRSISRERNKQESYSVKDRSRGEYNFSSERGRYDRSSSLDRNKHTFSSSRGRVRHERSSSRSRVRHERSSSRGRSRHERSSSRGRSRHERSSSRGRGRRGRSSSRGRSRHERSSSRGRSRHERSFSLGKNIREHSSSRDRRYTRSSSRDRRHERSSSKSRMKYESMRDTNKHELTPSQDRSKHEHSSSQERSKHEHSFSRSSSHQECSFTEDKARHGRDSSRHEPRFSPSRKSYTRSVSQDRSRCEHRSSPNHSRSDRSSSEDSRYGHSSSSDSRHERSVSRDRSRHEYSSSRERSKHKHSGNRDRSRQENSSSPDKNRRGHSHSKKSSYEHSPSQDSISEQIPVQDRSRQDRSSSHDRKKHEHSPSASGDELSSSQSKSKNEINLSETKNAGKHSSNQGKNIHCVTSSQEKSRQENVSNQENIGLECNSSLQITKLEHIPNAQRVGGDKSFEAITLKEQSKTEERNSHKRSRSREKLREGKRPVQKYNKVKSSKYEVRYSRSRSSSTSHSSSSSSSSSHSSKPKIRSVPSVIKSFQSKFSDIDKKEIIFSEIKSVGKNISNSQSDASSTSPRKGIDINDYNKLSNVKYGRIDGDPKASDGNKRVPVHMRLGVLPRKRVIQMPKDVEAAFVNSSSSSDGENVNSKCKRQNIRIVTDVYGIKSGLDCEKKHPGKEKSSKRSPDIYQEKSKRVKTHR